MAHTDSKTEARAILFFALFVKLTAVRCRAVNLSFYLPESRFRFLLAYAQARLTQDYTHCVGIEILRPLHSAAQLVTNRYNAHVKGLLDRGRPQV